MSLTTVTVTGKWRLPDATIPTGTVRFEPSAAFQNTADDTFVVNSVEATLDASGAISVDLYATDDADTTPDGAQYVVTERIAGATRIYNVEIPSANPTVDLADLVPTTTPAAITYLTPSSHDARDHSAALSAASIRDLADGADVPVDDGTLAVGELVTVKSLSPLVVEGTASGTYLRSGAGNRTILLGDSISIGNTGDAGDSVRGDRDPLAWASLLSDSRIIYQRNAGVSGNTSAQMLSRMDADVIDHSPGCVVIMAGTNDAGASVALSTFSSNIEAMVTKARNIGANVVLCTVPPKTSDHAFVDLYNTWLAYYAAGENIPLVPVYQTLADASTGGLLSAYDSGDGIHPSDAGAQAIGQAMADVMADLLPQFTPPLPVSEHASNKNLLAGGLFLTDTNADGLGDGWSVLAGTGTTSIVSDANILGEWQRITNAGAANTVLRSDSVSFSAGDVVAVAGRLTASVEAGSSGFQINVNWTNSSGITQSRPFDTFSLDVTNKVFYSEYTVPAGTTGATVDLVLKSGSSSGEYAQWSQMAVLNLSDLGIA